MYKIKKLSPSNVVRSIGCAARMQPVGVVCIMFAVEMTPAAAAVIGLDCLDCHDGTVFVSGAMTRGDVVAGRLVCMLPVSAPQGWRLGRVRLDAISDLWAECGLPNRSMPDGRERIAGQCRRILRREVEAAA